MQYNMQYAIQNTICTKCIIYTLQRFLSAQLVSIYEKRIIYDVMLLSDQVCWQTK